MDCDDVLAKEPVVEKQRNTAKVYTLDYFFDVETWDKIGKNLEDFERTDMMNLAFPSLEKCIEFYTMYAKVKGFGVRNKKETRSKIDGKPTSKTMLCSSEGYRGQQHLDNPNRKYEPKRITRFGCTALIKFKWDPHEDSWYIKEFQDEHSHDLAPPQQGPFIRTHREVSDANKIRIRALMNSGVPPNATMRNLIQEAGGPEKVGFLKQDLYNYCQRVRKEEVSDGDAETVMAYLLGKQFSDPSFFLKFTRDEEKRLDKMFWCDGTSRTDYKAFGTVIAFDTTYKCNAYNKPFVVIVGVNHHTKTIPFGVALISNEKEETYKWVLEQLIEAGDNVAPSTIITDGDKAMANAIKAVLPNARHRLCLWHIMRNVKSNCGKRFCSGFMKCVDRCRTPDEFEKAWDELMTFYKVREKRWAHDLYRDKEKWAEAFMHGHFFAGMRSTQRCESMHSTLKKVLDKKLMLYKFVELYDQVLRQIRFSEDNQDYITQHTAPVVYGVLSKVKSHAATVYTRKTYDMICKELHFESRHIVKSYEEKQSDSDGMVKCFWLNNCENKDLEYLVLYSSRLQKMYCCCMKLEAVGIPCRHMFAVMKHEYMDKIPIGYILKRWTIHAKTNIASDSGMSQLEGNDDTAALGRFSFLSGLSLQICRFASKSFDSTKLLKDMFAKMIISLESEAQEGINCQTKGRKIGINDPKVVGGKGDNKNKKAKVSSKEQCTPTEGEDERLANSIDLNTTPIPTPDSTPMKTSQVNTNQPVSPNLSDILKEYMPSSYCAGEASMARDCYEVSHFEKDPTVFDWGPKTYW